MCVDHVFRFQFDPHRLILNRSPSLDHSSVISSISLFSGFGTGRMEGGGVYCSFLSTGTGLRLSCYKDCTLRVVL